MKETEEDRIERYILTKFPDAKFTPVGKGGLKLDFGPKAAERFNEVIVQADSSDESRVSNGTGQSYLARQRDRSFFIVLGQRDNGTSSKSCQGTGRDLGWDGTRQNGTEQERMF